MSEEASKVGIKVFKDSSGENASQFIPSHSLILPFKEVPASPLNKSVETKFHEALCLYSTVVPSRLLDEGSDTISNLVDGSSNHQIKSQINFKMKS